MTTIGAELSYFLTTRWCHVHHPALRTCYRGRRCLTMLATLLALLPLGTGESWAQSPTSLPEHPLVFGAFDARFDANGTFAIRGEGWPELDGSWRLTGDELTLDMPRAPESCTGPGRYRAAMEGTRLRLTLLADDCTLRRMILGASDWRPAGEPEPIPERQIAVTTAHPRPAIPAATSSAGSWGSFRGPGAAGVAVGQHLPLRWNGETGENVRWRVQIPGLAHSSPIVWDRQVIVTSAVSSDKDASFKPGLYGDGDASGDRSHHRFEVSALDKRSGEILWRRVAHEGVPIDKRHIKSTYANATPATDGRVIVAAFGSQGVYAFTMTGDPLWSLDLGRLDLGAYDVPSYEWGPASSPILWNGVVILQCDTQADSFIIALDAETGAIRWQTERDEIPSWGTPTVVEASTGPELVTNGGKLIRGYDPRSGEELWRLAPSSQISAPTPIAAGDLIVVASGRAPERPLHVLRAGARGELTAQEHEPPSAAIVWSKLRRGSYMPTPLIDEGRLYVLANNGVLDAYELATGNELYRQRLDHRGSGFSASPVAADRRIYLSSEDGDVLVIAAGDTYEHLATNPMGELLMATPAISEGVLYVRGAASLFAIEASGTSRAGAASHD